MQVVSQSENQHHYDVSVNAVMRFRLRTSHKISICILNRPLSLELKADGHEKRKKPQKGFARLSGLLVRLCVFCGDPSTASTASKRQSVRSPVIVMHKNPQLQPNLLSTHFRLQAVGSLAQLHLGQ